MADRPCFRSIVRTVTVTVFTLSLLAEGAPPSGGPPVGAQEPIADHKTPLIQCDLGEVVVANRATVTKAVPSLSLGPLFSDSGYFEEKEVDRPCDPGKALGPFPVAAGGKLAVRLTGSPPAPNRWSLYNNGTGLSVVYEPQIGDLYGPGQEILAIAVPAEETEVEGEGSWPGPGRLHAYTGAPAGSGPLTGQCFEQSYTVHAEVIDVFPSAPAQAGMQLEDGDRIVTEPTWGYALITGSPKVWVLPGSEIQFDASVPGVREGTLDLSTDELPNYWTELKPPEYLTQLAAKVRDFQSQGYLLPVNINWPEYNTGTLEMAYDRIKDMDDPCVVALELKLFLDANQGEWTELTLAKLAIDTALIWLLPNNWDAIDGVAKWAFGKVPLLGTAAMAENVQSTYDRFKKGWVGTVAAERARWTLAAYERSKQGQWSEQQIEEERRNLQQQSDLKRTEIEKLGQIFEAEVQRRTKARDDAIAEINRASDARLKQIGEETQAAYQALQQELAAMPVEDRGPKIEGRKNLRELREEEFWQEWRGKMATVELSRGAAISAVEIPYQLRMQGLANQYEREVAARLTEIARLQTERDALEKYSKPVARKDCESLRNLAASEQKRAMSCPPKRVKILNGGIRVVDNPRAPGGRSLSVEVGNFIVEPDGTEYSVEKQGETATVRVFDGQVRVTSPEGQVLSLEAGQQITLPDGPVSDFDPAPDSDARVAGIPLRDLPLDDDVPAPYGTYTFGASSDSKLPPDWVWQETDPNHYGPGDAALEMPEPGVLRVTVPNENEFWGHRSDAPRLLHKVTGDFDLEAEMLLECEGLHFAISEFLIFTPRVPLGYLKGQMNADGLGAQYFIAGGGWLRFQDMNKLAATNRKFEDGPDAPSTPVRVKLSRRGDVLRSYWSVDGGTTWTLSSRQQLPLPETLWAGWLFKRMAYDGLNGEPAVTTLSNIRLQTAPLGTLPVNAWDVVGFSGTIIPLSGELVMADDGSQPGYVQAYSPWPIPGDFDLSVRFVADLMDRQPMQERYIHIAATSNDGKNHAYVRHAVTPEWHRYDADMAINEGWYRYHYEDTQDHSGRVRLVRRDGIFSGYYWKDGDWVLIADWQEGFSDPVYLDFRFQLKSPYPSLQAVRFTIERLETPGGVWIGSAAGEQPATGPAGTDSSGHTVVPGPKVNQEAVPHGTPPRVGVQPTSSPQEPVITVELPTLAATLPIEQPGIAEFAVAPQEAEPGQWVTLSWRTSGGRPYLFRLGADGQPKLESSDILSPVGSMEVPIDADSSQAVTFALGLLSPEKNEWIETSTATVRVATPPLPLPLPPLPTDPYQPPSLLSPSQPTFGPFTFSSGFDEDLGQAVGVGRTFPANTTIVFVSWPYSGVQAETPYTFGWEHNGQLISQGQNRFWKAAGWSYEWLGGHGPALSAGAYTFVFYVDGQRYEGGSVTISEARQPAQPVVQPVPGAFTVFFTVDASGRPSGSVFDKEGRQFSPAEGALTVSGPWLKPAPGDRIYLRTDAPQFSLLWDCGTEGGSYSPCDFVADSPANLPGEIVVNAADKLGILNVSGAGNWAGERSNFPGQRYPADPVLRILFGSNW